MKTAINQLCPWYACSCYTLRYLPFIFVCLAAVHSRGQLPDFTASACPSSHSITVTVTDPGSGGPYVYTLSGCGTSLVAPGQPGSYIFTGIPGNNCFSNITVTDNAGVSISKPVNMPAILAPGIRRVYSYPCGPGNFVIIPVGGLYTTSQSLYRLYASDGVTLLAGPQLSNVFENITGNNGDNLVASIERPCGATSSTIVSLGNSTAIEGQIYCACTLGIPPFCSILLEADGITGAVYSWTSPSGTVYPGPYAPAIAANNGDWQLSVSLATGACTHVFNNTLTIQNCVNSPTVPVRYNYVRTQISDCRLWLQWSTALEENIRDFEVQIQTNSDETWHTTARVLASGEGDADREYRVEIPTKATGDVFIRLKETDLDGRFHYSTILKVKAPECSFQKQRLRVSPNPLTAGNAVTVILETSNTGAVHAELADLSGRVILKKKIIGTGPQKWELPLPALQSGIYLLRISGASGSPDFKLAKLVVQ